MIPTPNANKSKKTDAVEHQKVSNRVGLLFDEPPGQSRVAPQLVIRIRPSEIDAKHAAIPLASLSIQRLSVNASRKWIYSRNFLLCAPDSSGTALSRLIFLRGGR